MQGALASKLSGERHDVVGRNFPDVASGGWRTRERDATHAWIGNQRRTNLGPDALGQVVGASGETRLRR